jgi:hypothetical protein
VSTEGTIIGHAVGRNGYATEGKWHELQAAAHAGATESQMKTDNGTTPEPHSLGCGTARVFQQQHSTQSTSQHSVEQHGNKRNFETDPWREEECESGCGCGRQRHQQLQVNGNDFGQTSDRSGQVCVVQNVQSQHSAVCCCRGVHSNNCFFFL